MSTVTNIFIFSTEYGEHFGGKSDVDIFNEKLEEWCPGFTQRQVFEETTEWYGGAKRLEIKLIGGAFNGFPCEEELVEFFLTREWQYPESALLVIKPHEGALRTYRPEYPSYLGER